MNKTLIVGLECDYSAEIARLQSSFAFMKTFEDNNLLFNTQFHCRGHGKSVAIDYILNVHKLYAELDELLYVERRQFDDIPTLPRKTNVSPTKQRQIDQRNKLLGKY